MLIILILKNTEKYKKVKISSYPIVQREPDNVTYFLHFYVFICSVSNINFYEHIYINKIERECLFLTWEITIHTVLYLLKCYIIT